MKERDCCCDADRIAKLMEAFLSLNSSQKAEVIKRTEEIHNRRSL